MADDTTVYLNPDDRRPYTNTFGIDDFTDVMNLAKEWEIYWQPSKRMMNKGFRWYYKEIPIVTPKKVEAHVPSTARTLVNDAADHLSGSKPDYDALLLRESQRADDDRNRVVQCLNSTFKLIGKNEGGHPLHRQWAIHGGWSGMMAGRLGVREGWDPKAPSIKDIYWKATDPRYVYPDPSTGGRKAVIIKKKVDVGQIRKEWPNWEGHWFPANGWDGGMAYQSPNYYYDARNRLQKPLSDNAIVDWVEYWDDTYKCFVANGVPLFREEYGHDLIEHELGFVPFVIRAAGYGDDEGEGVYRYFSMLAGIFTELDAEARLITQLKWIIEETAFPIYLAPKDTEGQFELEPGTVSYFDNPDSIKLIKAIREDAVEPKAILNLLTYIKDEIEMATYPKVLKGQNPNGVHSGYPIAILAGQAKLKFAAPTDALKEMFTEMGMKTLQIVANRFKTNTEVIKGYKIKPTDAESYNGRIDVTLEPKLPVDFAAKLQLLTFLLGSTGFSKVDAIEELGYTNGEQIRQRRMAEDFEDDPRTRQVAVDHLIGLLSPEMAPAVMSVAGPNAEQQQLGQQVQEMQTKIQMLTEMQQLKQMQQPPQPPPQPQGMVPPQPGGPPQQPGPPPPIAPHPPAPPITSGGPGGSVMGGQNPLAPNAQAQLHQTIAPIQLNPLTIPAVDARSMRAYRTLGEMTAQNQEFGNIGNGGLG